MTVYVVMDNDYEAEVICVVSAPERAPAAVLALFRAGDWRGKHSGVVAWEAGALNEKLEFNIIGELGNGWTPITDRFVVTGWEVI